MKENLRDDSNQKVDNKQSFIDKNNIDIIIIVIIILLIMITTILALYYSCKYNFFNSFFYRINKKILINLKVTRHSPKNHTTIDTNTEKQIFTTTFGYAMNELTKPKVAINFPTTSTTTTETTTTATRHYKCKCL
jgi:hypothetical protein